MNTKHIVLTYGIAIGVGISFWILAEHLLGFHTTRPEIGRYTGYGVIAILVLALWSALKAKGAQTLDGRLSITKGVATSFLISFVAGIILGAFMYSYAAFINPEFTVTETTKQIEALRAQGIPEEQIIEAATAALALYSPFAQALSALLGTLVQGTVTGLAISLILRMRKPRV